jgi:hypothetical protein
MFEMSGRRLTASERDGWASIASGNGYHRLRPIGLHDAPYLDSSSASGERAHARARLSG